MIRFQLVTATGTRFDEDAFEIILPAQGGDVAVFEDHMPLISAAQPGVISIRKKSNDKDDDMQHFAVNGGVLEVDGKTLRFLADDVTAPEDVSEKEAEAAMAHAEELVKGAGSQTALAEAHRLLHHSRAQLNIARLKRRHHS
ncbi:MAG TPA: ATP synthase F1 subunit epsilon [Candidatus Saccharimonadales bacterium]|nr:ATP synthase F1 subunit epsilon [Candidatus Saccharimonadales bacterium]